MDVLARQGDNLRRAFSLTRDNQMREQLQAALDAILGVGVAYGGDVSKTAALAVELAAGTKLWRGGMELELAEAVAYNDVPASGEVHLWARIKRVAADAEAPEDPDTYEAELTHTATSTSPGDGYRRVATFDVTAGDIDADSINNLLPDKFVAVHSDHFNSFLELDVAGGDDVALTADQARRRKIKLTGTLTADIDLVTPSWPGVNWTFWNATEGAFSLTAKPLGGLGITIPQDSTASVWTDGTDLLPEVTQDSVTPVLQPPTPSLTDPTANETALLGFMTAVVSDLVGAGIYQP